MSIVPDAKDWTWVLERACPECGFEAGRFNRLDVGFLVRDGAREWSSLHRSGEIRAGRTDPTRWSSLEYACHVRDVFRRYDERFALMLTADDPLFHNWDQDASAIEEHYDEQDPARVIGDLVTNAARLADRLDAIDPGEWTRVGRRSDGACFTVESMSRYMVHDLIHHVWDVTGRNWR